MPKSVIYTAIFGGYDDLVDPLIISKDCDYVCFTDDYKLRSNIWDVRVIGLPIQGDCPRSNRYIKLHPHEYFSNYEYSMYIDGDITLRKTPDIIEMLAGYNIVVESHPIANCLYKEAKECKRLGFGIASEIDKQIKDYKRVDFPEDAGLWANWIIFRQHNDSKLIELEKKWWNHIKKYSWRDQISFPYIFRNYPIKTLPPYWSRSQKIVSFVEHLRKV